MQNVAQSATVEINEKQEFVNSTSVLDIKSTPSPTDQSLQDHPQFMSDTSESEQDSVSEVCLLQQIFFI